MMHAFDCPHSNTCIIKKTKTMSSTEELQPVPIFEIISKMIAVPGLTDQLIANDITQTEIDAVNVVLADTTAVVFSIARVI